VPPYGNEPESNGKRRDAIFAGLVLLLALSTTYLGEPLQQGVSSLLRGSVLRPFIATQQLLNDAQRRAGQVDELTARLDSVTAVMATQAAVMDENRTLRALLGLAERGGPRFVPATVLRPGTPGSRSMFILDVGIQDGVRQGSPVISPHGLVGVVREVRRDTSVGMDWSHPDFRASAMLVDGTTYGIVSRRAGLFSEDDRLILQGTAYSITVSRNTAVVTSGLGGVFPRGIPIGKVDRVLETEGAWRKSYWVQPMVEPGSVTHVLVLTEGAESDVSGVWPDEKLLTREEAIVRDNASPPRRVPPEAAADSVGRDGGEVSPDGVRGS